MWLKYAIFKKKEENNLKRRKNNFFILIFNFFSAIKREKPIVF